MPKLRRCCYHHTVGTYCNLLPILQEHFPKVQTAAACHMLLVFAMLTLLSWRKVNYCTALWTDAVCIRRSLGELVREVKGSL